MASNYKSDGSATHYDGLLSRPFLAEHWYKGFVAAALSFFLLSLLLYSSFNASFWWAIIPAGLVSLLLLAAIVTQQQRFELNYADKFYRSYLWVLGLRFGKRLPLPIIDSIKIRHLTQRHFLPLEESTSSPVGITATEDKWQVLLHVNGSPVGIIAAYTGQTKAVAIATELATLLGVAIVAR